MSIKPSAIFKATDVSENVFVQIFETEICRLCIGATDQGLKFIKLVSADAPVYKPNHITLETARQLKAYFTKEITVFDVNFDFTGCTDFSISVWNKLMQIPYGKTITYRQLAISMGDLKCIRAAANANARNPIPFIIPCHRVIGSDGSLTGFALGLPIKQALLELENPDRYAVHQQRLFEQ